MRKQEIGEKSMNLIEKVFGTHSERELKLIRPIVDKILGMREQMVALSDDELRDNTRKFKERLANGETLDDLLPEAFATVREAARRVLNMEHYPVQLIGGIVLHQGRIAEMRTGEGKTLVSTAPAYLNALAGKGVFIVTVNDYLAKRDAEWMGEVHRFLGLTVGVVLNSMNSDERREAYNCDITYVTNNELGFDYLRDNMAIYKEQMVMRNLDYAIIDEVDSVLIDEARTPLIISGQSGKSTKLYEVCDILARQLEKGEESAEFSKMAAIMGEEIEETGDFVVNEKDKVVNLTEAGVKKVEDFFHIENLADPENLEIQHNIILALRANYLMFRDKDYVVKDDEVLIVDEFTGRIMPGRRYSDGLHQAIEAKEHVHVRRESRTLATITFQNFFNKFNKKAGMTGTAQTEEKEFRNIYQMDVISIPTNRPVQRIDYEDAVYKTKKEKFHAVVEEVAAAHEKGQPVLVGTITIETSELLSKMLTRRGIPHKVLNAKFHELEAEIVADAGIHGAVTIATNMAGRGTDIVLGGNVEKQIEFLLADDSIPEDQKEAKISQLRNEWQSLHDFVLAQGGLHIIGTERHESRRVDNQLRGRAARQGDPGSSRFYLSLDDPLLRIFAGDKMRSIMERLKMPEGEPIESGIVTRSIESAQRKVEGRNFDMRKQLLEYDDVANDQRKVIYQQRNELLELTDTTELVTSLRHGVFTDMFRTYVPEQSVEEQWDIEGLEKEFANQWKLDIPLASMLEESKTLTDEDMLEHIIKTVDEFYQAKVDLVGKEAFAAYERSVMLQSLDNYWREHLAALDHLRQGIHLRGYAQKNPKQEYKFEAFQLFSQMLDMIKNDVTKVLMLVRIQTREEVEMAAAMQEEAQYSDVSYDRPGIEDDSDSGIDGAETEEKQQPVVNTVPKVGRNDPCPCQSGKKYKHCHGRLE